MGLINKADVSNAFNSGVRSSVYSSITWHSGNLPVAPGQVDSGSIPTSWFRNKSSLPSMGASNVASNVIVEANEVTNSLVSYCRNYYTQVHNVRMIYRYQGEKTDIIQQQVNMSYVDDTTSISSSLGIGAGQTASIPSVSNLLSAWRSASGREKSFTLYKYASHASHGSRARR